MVIKQLKIQNKIARMGYNKYCPVCKIMFEGDECPQCTDTQQVYNALYKQMQVENQNPS